MMRLLAAELHKLNRPLLWGVMFASALFCVLLAVSGADNARRAAEPAHEAERLPSCAQLRLPDGPSCASARAAARARAVAADEEGLKFARHTAAQLDPLAAGAEAAGLMASLPGALAMALLAGGHVGGEWSGRTLKSVLTRCGRRWRVVVAKLVSLWVAGAGLVLVSWAALAVAGPVLVRADHLPEPHQSVAEAAGWACSQVARASLVLAVFAAIGVLAAVVTRGTVGTMAAAGGGVTLMLVVAAIPVAGRWTPATWVQGWMGFGVGLRSFTPLPNNFWSRFIDAGQSPPGHVAGFAGLVATLGVCSVAGVAMFRRADVS
jgi:ABC-2 family transporter protein